MPEELRVLFSMIETRFVPGAVTREISYYFKLGEQEGERWTVRIGPEACEVKEGKHVERADCVLKAPRKLVLGMLKNGKVPTAMDFMRGKLKSNDPMLLQDLARALGFG